MIKNFNRFALLCIGLVIVFLPSIVAQEEDDKKLERPDRCDVTEIDNFVNKCFDSYEESLKITKAVNFITGLCLLNTTTDQAYTISEPFTVIFRELSLDMIERYLNLEKPYNCAGSFKSEGAGIALCERFIGRDPTALEGLPLMQLCRLLAQENLVVI